jgi:SAM-dependent methyltransferase
MMPSGSVPFDRAAAIYDRTRVTDETSLGVATDLLDDVIPRGPALEIGVGTGALALPLSARGRRVVGVDLSVPMLERLRAKDGDRRVLAAVGDATRLPFATERFAGAYCRWVLHLIASWRDAVGELCRVVRRGGVIIVEPGGYSGQWRRVWLRFVEELGEPAAPIGLDVRGGYVDLDEVFASLGATRRAIVSTPGVVDSSLERFFTEAAAKSYSWTWRVPDDELARAIEVVRAWAIGRFGPDLTTPFERDAPHRWRVYDLRN